MAEDMEPKHKKARTGVGSSVAELVRSETDDFVLVLTKTKAERLLPKGRTVISTDTSEELSSVFKKLVKHNIISVPVLNQKHKYYGMVEMYDLVEFVTTLFSDLSTTKLIDLEKMLVSERKFLHATVKDVIKSPFSRKKNSNKTLSKGFSLFCAWEVLAVTGSTRLAILGEQDEVVDIISPSMLIDFLWQNIEKVGLVAERKVGDFVTDPTEELETILASTKAIVAFRDMVRLEKSGLGVIDDTGKLVDNISARDLKGIHTDANVFWRLWSSISEYKKRERSEHESKVPSELVHVTRSDTLYTVVEKMAVLHIHRIYVVDSHMKPLRVITQTDILREILGK
jgi:CBS-domain-containing membrane protein